MSTCVADLRGRTRVLILYSFPFFLASGLLYGADPLVVTGSIAGPIPTSPEFDSYGCAIQLQGFNLSLTASHSNGCQSPAIALGSSTGTAVVSIPSTEDFRVSSFVPGQSVSLTFNGTTYTNVLVDLQMNLTGGHITVPIMTTYNLGVVDGTSTGGTLPFTSMSGMLSVYSSVLPNGNPTGLIFAVPIAGVGSYSASVATSQGYGSQGATYLAESFSFTPGALPNGSSLALDGGTQGTWNGAYGADGYVIANGNSKVPSYASVGFESLPTYTWAGATADIRALQNGAGETQRIAATFVAPNSGRSFTIPVQFNDGLAHRVALYLLDWDTQNARTETITLTNHSNGTVIDSESFSNFTSGAFAVWDLSGAFDIKVTATGNAGPVLSGIFFGGAGTFATPPPLASSALFVNTSQLNGLWSSRFGSQGYLIANDPYTLAPTYATVAVQGAFPYTWASQLNPIQGLQLNPQTNNSIASAFTQYASKSFQIHVDIYDGNSHAVNLCLFDYDNEGRVETVTISDAYTGTVLDTRTFQSFQSEQYPIWIVSGNVIFTISPVGQTSPVVSGVFFN